MSLYEPFWKGIQLETANIAGIKCFLVWRVVNRTRQLTRQLRLKLTLTLLVDDLFLRDIVG